MPREEVERLNLATLCPFLKALFSCLHNQECSAISIIILFPFVLYYACDNPDLDLYITLYVDACIVATL